MREFYLGKFALQKGVAAADRPQIESLRRKRSDGARGRAPAAGAAAADPHCRVKRGVQTYQGKGFPRLKSKMRASISRRKGVYGVY